MPTPTTPYRCRYSVGDGNGGECLKEISAKSEPLATQSAGASIKPDAEEHLLIAPLTARQQLELQDFEGIIEKGWRTFVEVGQALARIRDGRLYRDRYGTFEVYGRERWQYGKNYINKLIAASEVVVHLVTIVPMAPRHEFQVRPLIGLSKGQAAAAWQNAVEAARGGTVTAKLVKAAAAEFKPA